MKTPSSRGRLQDIGRDAVSVAASIVVVILVTAVAIMPLALVLIVGNVIAA
jgi:hypothetical protein